MHFDIYFIYLLCNKTVMVSLHYNYWTYHRLDSVLVRSVHVSPCASRGPLFSRKVGSFYTKSSLKYLGNGLYKFYNRRCTSKNHYNVIFSQFNYLILGLLFPNGRLLWVNLDSREVNIVISLGHIYIYLDVKAV